MSPRPPTRSTRIACKMKSARAPLPSVPADLRRRGGAARRRGCIHPPADPDRRAQARDQARPGGGQRRARREPQPDPRGDRDPRPGGAARRHAAPGRVGRAAHARRHHRPLRAVRRGVGPGRGDGGRRAEADEQVAELARIQRSFRNAPAGTPADQLSSLNERFHRIINACAPRRTRWLLRLLERSVPADYYEFAGGWNARASSTTSRSSTRSSPATSRRARRAMEHHLHESGVAAADALRAQGFWE